MKEHCHKNFGDFIYIQMKELRMENVIFLGKIIK